MAELFDDGSSIEWVDRETVRYKEGELSALIWVDFEAGLFLDGRIIKASSIHHWEQQEGNSPKPIGDLKKHEIIEKTIMYYRKLGKPCRLE